MIVELKNVSKSIRGADIINDVSARFESGVVTGLKGVNGSGKTMILRLIAGLIRPTKGEVVIDGEILWRDISFPKSIGILIENPAFLDYYSGFDNLKLLASIQNRIDDEKIRNTIKMVGLDPHSKKKYKKYSLGMKQRLGIAAAVMESPDMILLDEPTNALDISGVEMVKEIIKKEKAQGKLIILACHDQEILEYLSDRILCVEEGHLNS